jgi:hypothetical protein
LLPDTAARQGCPTCGYVLVKRVTHKPFVTVSLSVLIDAALLCWQLVLWVDEEITNWKRCGRKRSVCNLMFLP